MGEGGPRVKKGPKPKDPGRVQMSVLLPAEIRARVEELAERDGQALGNVIARLLAESLELPVPAYCLPKNRQQQELPLKEAS